MGNSNKLTVFKEESIIFVVVNEVASGVICDSYSFVHDSSKDLAIVTVAKGCKTPLQKIIKGDKTLEGFYSGSGCLIVTDLDGKENTYVFPNHDDLIEVEVTQGQIMQWQADAQTNLVFYEICFPPFKEGRFEKNF